MNTAAQRVLRIASMTLAMAPCLLMGYKEETHRAISLSAIYRSECGVDSYLKKRLLVVDGQETRNSGGLTLAEALGQGAFDEDGPASELPFLRHFYNPITNKGLSNGSLTFQSALLWAWSDKVNLEDQHLTWQDARKYYYRWLTTGSDLDRTFTFVALGHVIHLLQDMAQPQHTRNDPHDPLVDGAPYEDYCLENYDTVSKIGPLIQAFDGRKGLPQLRPAPLTALDKLWKVSPEFKAFWDTEQYNGTAPPPNALAVNLQLGLAEYSNAYFVTDDTMFTSDFNGGQFRFANGLTVRLNPAGNRFPYPSIAGTNLWKIAKDYPSLLNSGVRLERFGEVDLSLPTWDMTLPGETVPTKLFSTSRPMASSPGTFKLCLTNANFKSYAGKLIPRAVFYSAGLLNYFFRDKISVERSFDEAKKSYVLTIGNYGAETFGAGTWELFQSELPGNVGARHKIPLTGSYAAPLAPWGAFNLSFPQSALTGHGPLTLVFRGTIGNEQNVAVAATTFNITRLRMTWSPSADLGIDLQAGPLGRTFDGTGGRGFNQGGPVNYMLNVDYWPRSTYFPRSDPAGRYQCTIVYYGIYGANGATLPPVPVTAKVETFLNSASPVRVVSRLLPTSNQFNRLPGPPLGLSEGPYPRPPLAPGGYYITQIINLQPNGFVTLGDP